MRYFIIGICLLIVCSSTAQLRTLDFFIETARKNSPTLKDFQNQVLSLSIDSQLLKASLRTQVNFLSNNSYAPVVKGWGYDEAITNIANVSGLVQASRNFLTRGNISAQYRSIALQRRALLDTLLLSQQDLIRTITDQYITAYGDLLAVEYNKELYEVMRREESTLKKLTEASVYKQTDYLTFYVTMQQQELLYLQAQIQYNTDYLTLNYLAGLTDTSVTRIDKPMLTDTITGNFSQSVFYNRFITDSLRLENEKALINFEYRPKIAAYTDAGYNSSMQITPYKNVGWSAGVSLTFPIYDGRQKQMKYSRIAIQENTRQYNRNFYLNQYYMQRLQLYQQLKSIDLLVEKINKQIEYSHTLILANGKMLETGDITMRDYVTAINNYLNAQNLLTQNSIDRLRIQNQINYWTIKP
jgi:outer membrane protein TolC